MEILKKIHCPFCGEIMNADIHPESYNNRKNMDNWICIECKSLNGDTIVLDAEVLIDIIATPSDNSNKLKKYYNG